MIASSTATVVVLLGAFLVGCGRASTPAPASPPSPPSQLGLAERLADSRAERRTWRTGDVKVNLRVPEIHVCLLLDDSTTIEVEAWRHNDFDVPMFRLNRGNDLREMSEAEWREVLGVARSPAAPRDPAAQPGAN